METTWQAELMAGYRFHHFAPWDINVLVGYKAVGVDVASGSKEVENDVIYHGPVLKLGLEF